MQKGHIVPITVMTPLFEYLLSNEIDKEADLLFVKVDSVMMGTTGITTTSGMLAMLANSAMTVRDVTA